MIMATSGEVNPQQKQPKMESIIHYSDDREKLVSLQGVDSRETLPRAALSWGTDSNNWSMQQI